MAEKDPGANDPGINGPGGDTPGIEAVNETDRLIDALGAGASMPAVDPLASMLADWRDDARSVPPDGVVSVSQAAAALEGARRPTRTQTGQSRRTRFGITVLGAVAASLLCLGGFGAVIYGAGPGDPLYGLRTMLFGETTAARDEQVALAAQTKLAQVQQLIDEGQWEQAQTELATISTNVQTIENVDRKQELVEQWNQLTVKVVERDPEATLAPDAPPPVLPPVIRFPLPQLTAPTTTSTTEPVTTTSTPSTTSVTSPTTTPVTTTTGAREIPPATTPTGPPTSEPESPTSAPAETTQTGPPTSEPEAPTSELEAPTSATQAPTSAPPETAPETTPENAPEATSEPAPEPAPPAPGPETPAAPPSEPVQDTPPPAATTRAPAETTPAAPPATTTTPAPADATPSRTAAQPTTTTSSPPPPVDTPQAEQASTVEIPRDGVPTLTETETPSGG